MLVHSTVRKRQVGGGWPAPIPERIENIALTEGGLVDLWELSPIRLETNTAVTESLIDQLFPGDPLLCCGWDFLKLSTRPRSQWRGLLANTQFIVPSPMTEIKGRTDAGKLSYRSLSNTGRRRFLVVEFDFCLSGQLGQSDKMGSMLLRLAAAGVSIEDLCAALLIHLGQRAPLALVAHSGARSLHGWFYCLNQPQERLRKFMEYAVSLGADPITWTPCQFVRMPEGLRDNGRRQRMFFFNPWVLR